MSTVLYEADFNYVSAPEQTRTIARPVMNGREFHNPGWQETGFELINFPSELSDWSGENQIADIHYPEVIARAEAMTGCDFALVSSHILRNPEKEKLHPDLGPIHFVHSDFAENYGDLIKASYLENEDVLAALQKHGVSAEEFKSCKRLQILQFWRNVGPAQMDFPITFCDARSCDPADMIKIPVQDDAGGGFDFHTLVVAVRDDARHDWYAFPDMSIDEAIAFRTYDSELAEAGEIFWTPHSAHQNPAVEPGSPARRSIELRATCITL